MKISRHAYAEMFGPTVGDRLRLADTDLWIEVEKDFTVYGEEVKFGGGKVIRDGMGQSQLIAAKVADTVITNALIIDHWGIVKADIGIKNGRIWKIGKAGNPDMQPGVTIPIGAATEAIAGEGKIVTAGGIDAHIHFICPQQIDEALMSGVTTMLGGGTGPATGTYATTCTPGAWHIRSMLAAAEAFPMNLGFFGKGNASVPVPLVEQVKAGAIGLKLHEDWGTTPAAIDNCLAVADKMDVQVAIHTDTLNESGFVETTVKAFKGRTIHTFHTEGAGGGHADLITYNRLLTQVKQLDGQYARELEKAMKIARHRGGEPDLETKARLLSIRDQRDRLMSRLTMLALRHGWEVPQSGPEAVAKAVAAAPQPHEEIFRGADHIIHGRFQTEAARIARSVELPMIAPPASFGAARR